MSDAGFSEVAGEVQGPVPSGEITAGSMMRSAREAAGLHVAALAVSMKIPVKKLEALEADRLDLLHDAVFVRALAASVCRALKLDPAPILNKLPVNAAPKLAPDERGINAPFHSHSDATGVAIPALLTKPSTLMVLALLVAGIAVFFFPNIKVPDWAGEFSSSPTKSVDGENQSSIESTSTEMVETRPESVTATVALPDLSSASAIASAEPIVQPAAMAPSADVHSVKAPAFAAPSVAASQPVAVASRPTTTVGLPVVAASRPSSAPVLPSTGMVVFKAKAPTWVKVVDAGGSVLLSKTIVDGEVVGASGTPPLSVVIGRVDATDVEVRGQPFALTNVSKDNVARFEVK